MTSATTSHWSLEDNFLTPHYHQELLDFFGSDEMDWYYQGDITRGGNPEIGKQGFSHNILDKDKMIPPNPVSSLVMPLLFQIQDYIGCENVTVRARADMTLYNPNGIVHHPHVDFETPHMAAIYYLNETDGDTIIFNEKFPHNGRLTQATRVSPKPNRLLIFEGLHLHTGHSPKKHPNRIIINSNYV
tara:strand:+ start:352 stop:912 length:561 start_codon:yes stop_codon:yes gene_type:complete